MQPADYPFKNQIFIHEYHENQFKNAKSQFERAKIPSEYHKTQFDTAKTQKNLRKVSRIDAQKKHRKNLKRLKKGIRFRARVSFFEPCLCTIWKSRVNQILPQSYETNFIAKLLFQIQDSGKSFFPRHP